MADTIHIDLSEFTIGDDTYSFPGQWIDVVDPGHMTPKQFRANAALAQSSEDDAAGKLLAALVTAWHVLNPLNGEALPAPDKADTDDIPLAISKRFTTVVFERMTNLGTPFRGS